MTRKRILIDSGPERHAPQLLAALLDHDGDIVPMTPGQPPAPDDEVWFLSQRSFMEAAGRMAQWQCRVSVILRRPRDEKEINAVRAEISILQSVEAGMPDTIELAFFALSDAAADYFVDLGVVEVEPLTTAAPSDKDRALAEVEAASERFRLMRTEEQGSIGFNDVNWARLARDYRVLARYDNSPDMLDLADLFLRLPDAPPQAEPEYLFVTPNGIGLGHLTRQLAVARALQNNAGAGKHPRITFWCFSRGATIVREAGFNVILRHTAEHLGAEPDLWQSWETSVFAHYLRARRPAAIIADGSRVEPFIIDAMAQPGCHHSRLVWIRRGMWRADADDGGMADVRFCDLVLVPGDLAASADAGATSRENPNPPGLSREVETPPVLLRTQPDPLPRRAARRALKLGLGPVCLVSLGGDSFARTSIVHRKIAAAAERARVRLVWAHSPLAAQPEDTGEDDRRLALYPLNPYLAGFDGAISAAGYNSFHELLLLFDKPVLFVPTTNARVDDQTARARFASEQGWAMLLDHEAGQDEDPSIDAFFAALRRKQTMPRPRLTRDGATEMASHILNLDHGPA